MRGRRPSDFVRRDAGQRTRNSHFLRRFATAWAPPVAAKSSQRPDVRAGPLWEMSKLSQSSQPQGAGDPGPVLLMPRLCESTGVALEFICGRGQIGGADQKVPRGRTSDFHIGRSPSILQETVMSQLEPPSGSAAPLSRMFHIGRNSRGNWVVKDQKGLCGGLFVDRAEALKFAMFENGNRPQAVIMVPGVLELDMTSKQPQGRPHAGAGANSAHARAA